MNAAPSLMRPRVLPSDNPSKAAGFSLIELLVAVLIIVLLTTVVGLNVGTGGKDILLENEVEDLAATLSFVQAEAELSGADHGLLIEFDGLGRDARYHGRWRRLYDQGWAPPQGGGDTLADITFFEDIELVLLLDGQPEVLLEPDPDVTNPPPQLQLYAGGEMTPGALEWLDRQTGELLWRLEWDLFGRMTLMRRGELDEES